MHENKKFARVGKTCYSLYILFILVCLQVCQGLTSSLTLSLWVYSRAVLSTHPSGPLTAWPIWILFFYLPCNQPLPCLCPQLFISDHSGLPNPHWVSNVYSNLCSHAQWCGILHVTIKHNLHKKKPFYSTLMIVTFLLQEFHSTTIFHKLKQ